MGHYPELVRDCFDLPEQTKVLFGISFGYEDSSIPANQARTTRATIEDCVVFAS